jgi:hypothetical protein
MVSLTVFCRDVHLGEAGWDRERDSEDGLLIAAIESTLSPSVRSNEDPDTLSKVSRVATLQD